jgi:hypothetical protein
MKNLSENVRALVCACGKVYQLKVKFFVTASSYERAAAKEREGSHHSDPCMQRAKERKVFSFL